MGGTFNISEIKRAAKEALSEQRLTAISLMAMTIFVIAVLQSIPFLFDNTNLATGAFLPIFIGTVIAVVGINSMGEFIQIARGREGSVREIFSAENFLRKALGMWLKFLFVILWTLLFIIPGIVKFFSYYFVPYILADSPGVTAVEAISISSRMTRGYKWRIFVFILSWLGWWLLSVITLGIVWIFYAGPYYNTAVGVLYLNLKERALEDGIIEYAEFS